VATFSSLGATDVTASAGPATKKAPSFSSPELPMTYRYCSQRGVINEVHVKWMTYEAVRNNNKSGRRVATASANDDKKPASPPSRCTTAYYDDITPSPSG
jgi:hypothetical protein